MTGNSCPHWSEITPGQPEGLCARDHGLPARLADMTPCHVVTPDDCRLCPDRPNWRPPVALTLQAAHCLYRDPDRPECGGVRCWARLGNRRSGRVTTLTHCESCVFHKVP